jgi:hypothetical protein
VHLECFCARIWTEKHSNSYGLMENACAETLQMCMKRNSGRTKQSEFDSNRAPGFIIMRLLGLRSGLVRNAG